MPEQLVITADLEELPLAASLSKISSPALVVVGEVIRLA
jgi:siroheme synthase